MMQKNKTKWLLLMGLLVKISNQELKFPNPLSMYRSIII
jgi:hypothetical protein